MQRKDYKIKWDNDEEVIFIIQKVHTEKTRSSKPYAETVKIRKTQTRRLKQKKTN